jgi:hypothetical protein
MEKLAFTLHALSDCEILGRRTETGTKKTRSAQYFQNHVEETNVVARKRELDMTWMSLTRFGIAHTRGT